MQEYTITCIGSQVEIYRVLPWYSIKKLFCNLELTFLTHYWPRMASYLSDKHLVGKALREHQITAVNSRR